MFYFDRFQLLTQRNGDAGDCAAETGTYHLGLEIRRRHLRLKNNTLPFSSITDLFNAIEFLKVKDKPGYYVRHPDPCIPGNTPGEFKWNNPKEFSRDNQTPLELAMSAHAIYDCPFDADLFDMWCEQKSRFLKYQNLDFPNPEHLTFKLIGLGICPKWLLYLGHSFAVGMSLIMVIRGLIEPEDREVKSDTYANDVKHTIALAFFHHYSQTFVSRFACFVYFNLRPKNLGNTLLKDRGEKENEKCPVQGAFSWYYRTETGNIFEMADVVWRPIIEDMAVFYRRNLFRVVFGLDSKAKANGSSTIPNS